MRSAEPVPSPACAGPAPGHSLRRLRVALGTWVAIEATAQSEATAADAIEAAYAPASGAERRLPPERAGSDIARINSAPLSVHTPIHASTWEVLRLARRLNELSRGVFDPCLPSRPGRMSDLELSGPATGSSPWVAPRAPLALDLGGIAKGYAIDRAIAALRTHGCEAGGGKDRGGLRRLRGRGAALL